MELSNITWPVYWLGNIDLKHGNSIVYIEKEYLDKTTLEIHVDQLIIDDTSRKGDTLGKRRLQMLDSKLFSINKAIYFLTDLVKLANSKTWFIDNTGKTFIYKKTIRAKLTCHRIKNILPGVSLGVLVEVEGIPQRFKLMYQPTDADKYAGLLFMHNSYIIYGLYSEPFKNSYRKI